MTLNTLQSTRSILAVTITALLMACSSQPKLPDFNEVPTVDAWQANSPEQVVVNSEQAEDLSQWWQQWQDPVLNQLLEQVLANNPSLESAGISHQIALVQAGVATASFRPKGNVGLGASHSESKATSSTSYNASANASWELDLWGTSRAYKKKAQATVERTQEELHAAQVSLAAQTVSSYINLRSAQANQRLAQQTLELREENYQLAQWQRTAGIATELQEAQALTLFRQAQAQVPVYEKHELQALQELQALAGGELTDLLPVLRAPQELPVAQQNKLIIAADVLRQRPDVKAKEQAVYEQSAAVVLARHARYPSFSLSGSIGSNEAHFSDLFDANRIVSRLAANLSLLMFDGGVLRRAEQVQKLQLDNALVNYRNTLLVAQQEAENALTALDSAQRQQESYQQALAAAELGAELAAMQYDAGLLDFAELLSTQTSLVNSRSAVVANQADILTSWVQLYRSLGGGIQ